MSQTSTRVYTETLKHSKSKDYEHDINDSHDSYRLRLKPHPWFQHKFGSWYQDGDTVTFPDTIALTPKSLMSWYVGDWDLRVRERSDYCSSMVRFTTKNEADNMEKIRTIISSLGFQVNIRSKRKNGGRKYALPSSETEEFLEFMGSPPPGFAYKWCHDSKTRYRELKEFHDNVCMTQTFTESPPENWKQRHPHHWTPDGQPKYDQYHFDPR